MTSHLKPEEAPVHLILGASPPWGMYLRKLPSSIEQMREGFDKLCHRMALANYTAQLSYALLVAKNNPGKAVELHIVMPKLQIFHNDPEVVMKALKFATGDLRKKMNEAKIDNIVIKISNA